MPGSRIQRNLATASSVLAVFVLAGSSESGARGPTAPNPPPPLVASVSPTADTFQMGQTVDFTVAITGGDPNAEPAWTCSSADTMLASAAAIAAGCSAVGTGIATTIAAAVTRGCDPTRTVRPARKGERHGSESPIGIRRNRWSASSELAQSK